MRINNKICKCGKEMKVTHHNDKPLCAECFYCNAYLDITEHGIINKTYDEKWHQRKFLSCKKCHGEFFANKFMKGNIVNWLKCINCGEDYDLRKEDIY